MKDLDFDRQEIVVRAGKGDKDRRVPLPIAVIPALRVHLDRVHTRFCHDLKHGVVGAALPDALGRKFPNAERDWVWQYVFPASRTYHDGASGVVLATFLLRPHLSFRR